MIKNADKGGSVVVLDSDTYRNEAVRQLSDDNTYLKLRGILRPPSKKDLNALLDRELTAGFFSQSEREMFIPDAPIMPIFHHLLKLHKGCQPLLGRPIVAGIGSLN